jgi:hypothetical protein
LVSTSPELIAAAHVLHRLLAPRHPPCALILLIVKNSLVTAMKFSRCARIKSALNENHLATVSQNSAAIVLFVELDVDLGEPRHLTTEVIKELGASGVIAPGSLERR